MANKNNNSHKGENWPYHEDKNGNMVPCASNPCKLHGGTDIMATSPEDATAKKYDSENAWGFKAKKTTESTQVDNTNADDRNTITKPEYESDVVKASQAAFDKANAFFDYISVHEDGYSLERVNMLNDRLIEVKNAFGSDRNGLANAFIQRYDTPFKGSDFEAYTTNTPKTDIELYRTGERVIIESNGIGMGPVMDSYESVVITGVDMSDKPGGVVTYVDNNGMAKWAYPEQIQAVQGLEMSFARSFEDHNLDSFNDPVLRRMEDNLDFKGDVVGINSDVRLKAIATWNGKWVNGYVQIPEKPARIRRIVDEAAKTGDYTELERLTGEEITYADKNGIIGIDSAMSSESTNASAMMRRLKSIQKNVNTETYHPSFTAKQHGNATKLVNKYPAKTSGFVFKPDDGTVIKPPVHNDNNGYMGGHRFVGGKYYETSKLPMKEVAKLMRADVKALKQNSAVPKDWKVSIRQQNWSMATGYDVRVSAPKDSPTPAYRTPTFDDYMHNDSVSTWMKDDMKEDGLDTSHLTEESYNAFINDYNAKNPNSDKYRIMTDDAKNAMDEIEAALSQYGSSDTNGMVDYFNSYRMPSLNSRSVILTD